MKYAIQLLILLIISTICFGQNQTEEAKKQVALAEFYKKACGGGYSEETSLFSTEAPTYKSANTKIIIEQMLKAHGGMQKWNSSPTLAFTHILVFGEPLATEFCVNRETTEIKTERTYHDWLAFDGKLTSDGTKSWTQNWQLGNPPSVNVNAIYYILALPWLTQKSEAVLEELPKAKLGNETILYNVVKMTFKKESKKSPYQYYTLYIHPETHLLKGIVYNITNGAFLDLIGLPKAEKSLGPFTHIIYTYKTVDGLIFPEKYDTFDPINHNAGRHIRRIDKTRRFDHSRGGKFFRFTCNSARKLSVGHYGRRFFGRKSIFRRYF